MISCESQIINCKSLIVNRKALIVYEKSQINNVDFERENDALRDSQDLLQ